MAARWRARGHGGERGDGAPPLPAASPRPWPPPVPLHSSWALSRSSGARSSAPSVLALRMAIDLLGSANPGVRGPWGGLPMPSDTGGTCGGWARGERVRESEHWAAGVWGGAAPALRQWQSAWLTRPSQLLAAAPGGPGLSPTLWRRGHALRVSVRAGRQAGRAGALARGAAATDQARANCRATPPTLQSRSLMAVRWASTSSALSTLHRRGGACVGEGTKGGGAHAALARALLITPARHPPPRPGPARLKVPSSSARATPTSMSAGLRSSASTCCGGARGGEREG